MSMKMGDLAKRKEPDAPAKNTTPLRQPVRPQGRPTRGKEKIKSRTMSLEDEYFRTAGDDEVHPSLREVHSF